MNILHTVTAVCKRIRNAKPMYCVYNLEYGVYQLYALSYTQEYISYTYTFEYICVDEQNKLFLPIWSDCTKHFFKLNKIFNEHDTFKHFRFTYTNFDCIQYLIFDVILIISMPPVTCCQYEIGSIIFAALILTKCGVASTISSF